MVSVYLILSRVEGGGRACTSNVHTTETMHGTNTHRHVLEASVYLREKELGMIA